MPTSKLITGADYSQALRVVGECRELGDDAVVWRQHLLARVAGLIDADVAAGGEMGVTPRGQVSARGAVPWGFENGFNPLGLQIVWEWNSIDPYRSLVWKRVHEKLQASGGGVTAAGRQLLTAREWDSSPDYQLALRTLGAEAILQSWYPIPGSSDVYEGICWFREAGSRSFNGREIALTAVIHQEVSRLIGGQLASFDEPCPSQLAPRTQQALRCMLEGDTDKQVAMRLDLSPHTARQYAKQIYHHFHVAGRGELLSRWVQRGWTAKAAWLFASKSDVDIIKMSRQKLG